MISTQQQGRRRGKQQGRAVGFDLRDNASWHRGFPGVDA